jgi:rhodanese-related sulfurtransferase/rubrerythrin
MRWRQYFTPVRSLSAQEAREILRRPAGPAATLLDVRQPGEYAAGHIPGAKLIPLTELTARLAELDAGRPAIVYCAIGGRSRVAAQLLAAKGFTEVFNLAGGIKAWNDPTAVGPEEAGLALFTGAESLRETYVTAYGLEAGLRDFYRTLGEKSASEPLRRLFAKLAAVEEKHQARIFAEYRRVSGEALTLEEFESRRLAPAVEGGLTTEEYLALYRPDLNAPAEVLALAMAIEAQALDLYQRAAERAESPPSREALMRIAGEEHRHIEQLAALMPPAAV